MNGITLKFKAGDVCVFTNRGQSGYDGNDGKQCVIDRVKSQEDWFDVLMPEYIITFLEGGHGFGARQSELELASVAKGEHEVEKGASTMSRMISEVVAFPYDMFEGLNLGGIKPIPLTVNGTKCLGISSADLEGACRIASVDPKLIQKKETDAAGIFLADAGKDRTGILEALKRIFAGKRDAKDECSGNDYAQLRTKYIDLCGNRGVSKRPIDSLRAEIIALQDMIERTQRDLVANLRALEEKVSAVATLEGALQATPAARFGVEFDTLIKHPDVEKLNISDGKIIVTTKPITINHERRVYDIGVFDIAIDIAGRVTFTNRTHRFGYNNGVLDHPHVYNGRPCLGNIKELVPSLIASHRYAALVSLCIQYLKSYEDDQGAPYSKITRWPLK